jgi:hypothetical protein
MRKMYDKLDAMRSSVKVGFSNHGPANPRRISMFLIGASLALGFLLFMSQIAPPIHRTKYSPGGGNPARQIQQISPTLPTSRSGSPTMDIVISMYKEPLDQTARMMRELKELEPLQGLNVNLYIYVKDLNADARHIRETTGATNVTILQNSGREAGTYFSHIVRNWWYVFTKILSCRIMLTCLVE